MFSHLEVQVYQQEQLLKQSHRFDTAILEMQLRLDSVEAQGNKCSERLKLYDEARTQDFRPLDKEAEVSGRTLQQMLVDAKTEYLLTFAQRSQLADFDERISAVEQRQREPTESEEVKQAVEQMQTFSKQTQSLQYQLMKAETSIYDLTKQVEHLQAKLGVPLASEPSESLKGERRLRRDLDDCLTQIRSQESQLTYVSNKIADFAKQHRATDKKIQVYAQKQEELRIIQQKALKEAKSKVEQEVYDEEMRQMNSAIFMLDKEGKTLNVRPNKPQQRKINPQSKDSGMSKEEKQKLEQAVVSTEQLSANLKTISSQLRQVNFDDI